MTINRRLRSLVAMLLTFCMVSVSLWVYSPEVLAHELSEEVSVMTTAGDSGDHGSSGAACNHSCHAATHLIGFDSSMPAVTRPDTVALTAVEALFSIPVQSRDGPFRPPRSALQA